MNCDRIAPFYEMLERLAFGGALQKHRTAYLKAACGKTRALVLGDGDGRFTAALAFAYPDLAIDFVDKSAGMVAQAGKRLQLLRNVTIIHADVFEVSFPADQYDIAFTHFFLDCFSDVQLKRLLMRVSKSLRHGAVWIVSEFRQAAGGWRQVYTGLYIAAMYLFFQWATGLETRKLPDYDTALQAAGFVRKQATTSRGGLIASQYWELAKHDWPRPDAHSD